MNAAERAECVIWYEIVYEKFAVAMIAPYQMRITRLKDGAQMDYFPKGKKACWLGFKKQTFFIIHDIETYIHKMFLK